MNTRQKLLLDEMIAIYIREGEPIGSESLRLMVDMKISSATIRNYFKVLSHEGFLIQPHISSGRIPTNSTLKSYWRDNLATADALEVCDLSGIESASNECRIFCNISLMPTSDSKLLEIINVSNRYTILVFEHTEIVLPYMTHLHNFATELVNLNIEEIKSIAKSVCARALFEKLNAAASAQIYNFGFKYLDFVNDMGLVLEILNGGIFYRLKNGIHFDMFGEGYLGLIQDIIVENRAGKMLLAGALNRDYKAFYNAIAS